jgi:hypothetical protein
MEDVQVAAAAYYFQCCMTERRAMCARFGTRASFDAEQKNRYQTHRRSHSARMPNIRRARARTLSTCRGECSAMYGGSFINVVGERYREKRNRRRDM